jgi:carbamoyl-phosphate synthase large subunit
VPRADKLEFTQRLLDICQKEKVNVIIPCTDHEVLPLSLKREEFLAQCIRISVSPPETIRICRDKWLTYLTLNKYLPIAKSALPDNLEDALRIVGLPAVIKPRAGWGARDVYTVNTIEEARILIKRVDNPLLQERLLGDEYTIDGLADTEGKFLCAIPRKRIDTRYGLSIRGVTVKDSELIELGEKLTKHLKLVGLFNFQVRKYCGRISIFEINPRFAGTGILSVMAGVNLPAIAVKNLCGMEIPLSFDFQDGLFITRYVEDCFVTKEMLVHN